MNTTLDAYMDQALVKIFAKVDKTAPGGCWQWTATVNSNGYGSTWWEGKRSKLVHRIIYQHVHGVKLESSVYCLHTCDNRRCVNPAHLFLGDHRVNMLDKFRKNRHARGEDSTRNKLTENDVREIRKKYRRVNARQSNVIELAKQYGVDRGAITSIISGRYWKHVQ